jgi:four helix bundle protein
MTEIQNPKPVYDLEERTFQFAKAVRLFVKTLPKTIANIEDGKQLIKASGSVGANYIEANESFGKKDFSMRIKISRKEAKESAYWLRAIHETNNLENTNDAQSLIKEANELKKIFHQFWKNQNDLNLSFQICFGHWILEF